MVLVNKADAHPFSSAFIIAEEKRKKKVKPFSHVRFLDLCLCNNAECVLFILCTDPLGPPALWV